MNYFIEAIQNGFSFIKKNPQIIFTMMLLLVIPLAFVLTSERFLSLAQQNQDRLERSRIGALQDVVAEFSLDWLSDPNYLAEKITRIVELNPTITSFRFLTASSSGELYVLVSSRQEEVGQKVETDGLTRALLAASLGDTSQSLASQVFINGERHWRGVRAISESGQEQDVFIFTEVSMAQADKEVNRQIKNAYIILIFVIIGVMVLLARQARIIDYASLYKRLQEVDQMKDDFVSMAAHELRSPLTVIRGYVDFLNDEKGISETGKTNLKRIDESAHSLSTLVGDILDVSKLQEGRMSFTFEPLNPFDILRPVIEAFQKQAGDKGLTLTLREGSTPNILVDKERFRQVIVNLVGNAIKYTPAGSIIVSLSPVGNMAEIRVSDTGMGISAEEQRHLFEKFYRIKNMDTVKITGTGLGLWITKEIVRQMKGEITVESIKGKGSDFIVRFPVAM